jgi:hypothetical protein
MPEAAPSISSVRFSYVYEGSFIELVAVEPIEMVVGPSDSLRPGPRAGFWYEVVDIARQPLWRRSRAHPLEPTIESVTEPDEDGRAEYQRGTPEPRAGSFTLVAPRDLPGAAFVVLVGTPPDGPDDAEAVDLFFHLIEPLVL